MLRRSRFAKKVTAEGAFRESVREREEERERETLKHNHYWNPFSRGVPFNFTAKEDILLGGKRFDVL